ncbi:ubiquinol--cytochrome-c reductase subunit 8 [Sticta canariensis]|nr:ubiquinol--cytochrome-c reductase subunit 8 [Sticta canariensis]
MGGGSGPPDKLNGQYLGNWGNFGTSTLGLDPSRNKSLKALLRHGICSPTQKGIVSYAISANRQRPLAGAAYAAVFNTWRRFRAQALYFIPPFTIAYLAMDWAIKKNEYYNSKAGRMADAQAAEEATGGGPVRG